SRALRPRRRPASRRAAPRVETPLRLVARIFLRRRTLRLLESAPAADPLLAASRLVLLAPAFATDDRRLRPLGVAPSRAPRLARVPRVPHAARRRLAHLVARFVLRTSRLRGCPFLCHARLRHLAAMDRSASDFSPRLARVRHARRRVEPRAVRSLSHSTHST